MFYKYFVRRNGRIYIEGKYIFDKVFINYKDTFDKVESRIKYNER